MRELSRVGLHSDPGDSGPVGEGCLGELGEGGLAAGDGGEAELGELVQGGGALAGDPGVGEGGELVLLVGEGGGVAAGDGDGEGGAVGAGLGGDGVGGVGGGCLVAVSCGVALPVDEGEQGDVADLVGVAGD